MLMWTNSKVSQAVEFVSFLKLWYYCTNIFKDCQYEYWKEFVLWINLELI